MVAEPCGSATSHRRPPAGGAESAEFVEKRNLLSVARCIVTNVEQEADEQQADSVREFVIKVEDELQTFHHGILVLMDKNLIRSASTGESKMTHYTRVSDYNRYLAGLAAVGPNSKVDKDVPVVLQRQVPVIQQVLKTVEVPQVHYVYEIIEERIVEKIDVPFLCVKGKIIDVVKKIPQERLVEETGVRFHAWRRKLSKYHRFNSMIEWWKSLLLRKGRMCRRCHENEFRSASSKKSLTLLCHA